MNERFYYPDHSYIECLEYEALKAKNELKNDIGEVWSDRLNELEKEIRRVKHGNELCD